MLSRRQILLRTAALPLAALAAHGRAQTLPDAVVLGMPESALRALRPGLTPNHRPARNASGALGRWSEPSDAEPLGPAWRTYYVAAGQLDQVDLTRQVGAGEDGAAIYAHAVAWLTAGLGPGLRSAQNDAPAAGSGPSLFESVSWTVDARDVYITRTATGGREVIRLVERRRHLQDASQL